MFPVRNCERHVNAHLQFNNGPEEWSDSLETLQIGERLHEGDGNHVEEYQCEDGDRDHEPANAQRHERYGKVSPEHVPRLRSPIGQPQRRVLALLRLSAHCRAPP